MSEFYRTVTIRDLPNAPNASLSFQTKKDGEQLVTSYLIDNGQSPLVFLHPQDIEFTNWLIQWFSMPEFLDSEFETMQNSMSKERKTFLLLVANSQRLIQKYLRLELSSGLFVAAMNNLGFIDIT